MQKKSQILSLPIIYIFIALVSALILIFGSQQIIRIKELSEKTQIQKELFNLQQQVNRIYHLSKGSSQQLTLYFPPYITDICFTSPSQTPTPISSKLQIINSIKEKNIFLFKGSQLIAHKNITYLQNQNFKCVETQKGRISLIIKNQGKTVTISYLQEA